MPIFHQYKNKSGAYVLTSIQGLISTFQLTAEGLRRLLVSGVAEGKRFGRGVLLDLCRTGDAYTAGSGPGEIQSASTTGQLELDFANDPEPETLFPICSSCAHMQDLCLVTVAGAEPSALVLCARCRAAHLTVDVCIPLPILSLATIKQLVTLRSIQRLDESITRYQELLRKDFTQRWAQLAAGRPRQEQLFDTREGGAGLL